MMGCVHRRLCIIGRIETTINFHKNRVSIGLIDFFLSLNRRFERDVGAEGYAADAGDANILFKDLFGGM
jgi:hypothetical protein